MDPEFKKLLEETFELAKENNDMLHSMRRSMRLQRIMSILYWVFIIGSAVGAYYLIQPYIDQLTNIYGGARSDIDNFNSLLQNFKK
ncbi:hypothetical protein A3C60_01145 [Candidatus Nomurabacteria bacterium RIFCSPHIGHO2_02_FULL_37_45]|uniref:Uncharacterized protein n=1 Tax=Candidatus Nomurabacteria bacterium RIFCSPHIGHO2_12_FULL_37_29 TaxID=1801759 RepID=A0A1F6WBL2_9BACT|nr:MAG: hypothetical protein A2727_01810 [Candidatus Nomurabacteria bacterium RIFCSPHIGHO2_01_FULL_37_110]OGI71246.1 MAG: hypothetical protein A3C60_01145 [Candidatus Nomurabacteria bacterium RIFCSPHIGHO2_02_FULL_37_45]OGI79303.1 MAG: hypothetical protein A3F19_02270 [Candidatus Nomurabacteria bacterium RIFCSPHIGHO2_12_FULL_37_29]OGI84852.1 MAG: hypothetical protein A3A92_00780 [Candidatus Nomurabacteria bacterium RIFCSPLOWO2_01_FULL_37_49]